MKQNHEGRLNFIRFLQNNYNLPPRNSDGAKLILAINIRLI